MAGTGKRIALNDYDVWVSVDQYTCGSPSVYQFRHIVRAGGLTSVCGATASTQDTWEPNSRKPRCPECVAGYPDRPEAR